MLDPDPQTEIVMVAFGVLITVAVMFKEFFIILCLVLLYTGWAFKRNSNKKDVKHETPVKERKKEAPPPQQQPKKKKQNHWQKGKQTFTHEWLLTSLKGHSGTILNMDFSANGKYLATCGDEKNDGYSLGADDCGAASSSGSEANKENASPESRTGLSRRQKKNKVRNGSPPTTKKRPQKRYTVLRQYTKLGLSDADLFRSLAGYILSPKVLFDLGYPVESRLYPGRAMIYKNSSFDADAVLAPNSSLFEKQDFYLKPSIVMTLEKKCVRCSKTFFISSENEYLTQEHCLYHWGKLQRPLSGAGESQYTCCKGRKFTKGCTTGKLHVWNGLNDGCNGPYDGYVRTKPKKIRPADGNFKIFALDCEMCYTTSGLELTKISVVTPDGRLIYDTHVRPESTIIDYNTRFSGVTAKDISKRAKPLKDVQNDLMGFISAETILVGHSLEHDLRALKMIHTNVVDTSIIFPHYYGLPYKRSLKSLVQSVLKRDIQCDPSGHDSTEDARGCLELLLWKVRKDMLKHFYDLNVQ